MSVCILTYLRSDSLARRKEMVVRLFLVETEEREPWRIVLLGKP